MRRVRKRLGARALNGKSNKDDIAKKIWEDQKGICYICERELTTDYEIDHLFPRRNYPRLMSKWRNLFLSCNYCNRKKMDAFTPLLLPNRVKIENEIEQRWNPMDDRFEMRRRGESEDHIQTERLLNCVFNNVGRRESFRYQCFRESVIGKLNNFCRNVLRRLRSGENIEVISEEVGGERELLTLKLSLLRDVMGENKKI